MTTAAILVTCEHASNRVPARYAGCFRGAARDLGSHRGYDPGALAAARRLARRFDAELFHTRVTRLLVEPNRSVRHPRVFSRYTRSLDPEERQSLLRRYYHPHRDAVAEHVRARIARGRRVIHIGVHSFTPVYDGLDRNTDIGLLYDPARRRERALCARWKRELAESGYRVRRNFPYRGSNDGFTTWLRGRFAAGSYLGLELELNQELARDPARGPRLIATAADALERALGGTERSRGR